VKCVHIVGDLLVALYADVRHLLKPLNHVYIGLLFRTKVVPTGRAILALFDPGLQACIAVHDVAMGALNEGHFEDTLTQEANDVLSLLANNLRELDQLHSGRLFCHNKRSKLPIILRFRFLIS
jgi:hypothetical protein